MVDSLLKQFPLISDQVNKLEVRVILRELENILYHKVRGDVVELGCYKGTTSLFLTRLMMQHSSNRKLYVYDSFEGLPPKSAEDSSTVGEQFVAGELHATKSELVRTFVKNNLPIPIIKRAWFGDLTPSDMPDTISFAFFDGDFYDSIRDSFQACGDRFSSGATIVIDDYDSEALPGAARATDEWLRRNRTVIKDFHAEQSLGIIHLR